MQQAVIVNRCSRHEVVHVGMQPTSVRPGGLNRYVDSVLAAQRAGGVRAIALGTSVRAIDEECGWVSMDVKASSKLVRNLRIAVKAWRLSAGARVIHIHFAMYGLLTLFRVRSLRIMHFHGPWAAESLAVGHKSIAVRVKKGLERSVYRIADHLIVDSDAFGKLLEEDYGVNPAKITRVYPGVDARFTPQESKNALQSLAYDLPEGCEQLVVAARRLVPRMGLQDLVAAMAVLPKVACVILGDGPQRGELQKEIERLHLNDRVRLAGRVTDEDLQSWYSGADLVTVPSLALEGFGLITLEALACGTPVVVRPVGGLAEAVQGFEAGWGVLPDRSLETLVSGLSAALTSLPTSDACVTYAAAWTWDRTQTLISAVYDSARSRSRL